MSICVYIDKVYYINRLAIAIVIAVIPIHGIRESCTQYRDKTRIIILFRRRNKKETRNKKCEAHLVCASTILSLWLSLARPLSHELSGAR